MRRQHSPKLIIKRYNKKVPTPEMTTPLETACNCRVKSECPLNGESLTKGIVYQAEVKTDDDQTKHYIETKEHSFKTRSNAPKQSFRNNNTSNQPLYRNTFGT